MVSVVGRFVYVINLLIVIAMRLIAAERRRYSRMGFTRGYSLGEEAGWREGYLFGNDYATRAARLDCDANPVLSRPLFTTGRRPGVKKGASLATEIGFYQGYTSAWYVTSSGVVCVTQPHRSQYQLEPPSGRRAAAHHSTAQLAFVCTHDHHNHLFSFLLIA